MSLRGPHIQLHQLAACLSILVVWSRWFTISRDLGKDAEKPWEPPTLHKLSYIAVSFLGEDSTHEINKNATTHWLKHAWACASVERCKYVYQHTAGSEQSLKNPRESENYQLPTVNLHQEKFLQWKCPRKKKKVPHWEVACCHLVISFPLIFCCFCFSPSPVSFFSTNPSPANSLIPGCFPAVPEVRSPHCSKQKILAGTGK